MPPSAARITPNLIAVLEHLDDGSLSIAEINRQVGAAAEALRLQRPSYERVRLLVHEARERKWRRGPSTTEVLLDMAYRHKSPIVLLDHALGLDRWDFPRPEPPAVDKQPPRRKRK